MSNIHPIVIAAVVGVSASLSVWMLSGHVSISVPTNTPTNAPQELSSWQREHLLCNKMVDILLHSKDLVEVTRSGLLVQRMNCDVGSRLSNSGE